MQGVFSITLVLLVALVVSSSEASRKHKGHKGQAKEGKLGAEDCPLSDWTYSKCVPELGDCGTGLRTATCTDPKIEPKKIECKIPCNWKKDLNDCKYRFTNWGECDGATGTKSRTGTLKKAMFNAECQATVRVSKPCSKPSAKPKKTRNEKKGRNGN